MAEMQITPERTAELRDFPQKDTPWTRAEALALIERVDGTDCIHGVPLPQYVQTEDDRYRWAACVRVASMSTGEPVASQIVQQTARTMFQDRDTYTLPDE